MSQKIIIGGILGLIGALFTLIGTIFIGVSYNAAAAAERVGAMTPLTAQQLDAIPAGSEVILEGRISERNPNLIEGLVAFTERQYQGVECDDNDNRDSCREVWTEIQRTTPALWLDISGGRLQISNSDYNLDNPPVSWLTTPVLIAEETREYRGFRMGSPVFVAGRIAAGAEVTLDADFIYGGSHADYLAGQHSTAFGFSLFGAIFGGIGLALLAAALYVLVKK